MCYLNCREVNSVVWDRATLTVPFVLSFAEQSALYFLETYKSGTDLLM